MSPRLVAKRPRRHETQVVVTPPPPPPEHKLNPWPAYCCPLRGEELVLHNEDYATLVAKQKFARRSKRGGIYAAEQTRNSSDHRLAEWPPEVARGHDYASMTSEGEGCRPAAAHRTVILSRSRKQRRKQQFTFHNCTQSSPVAELISSYRRSTTTLLLLTCWMILVMICTTGSAYQLTNNLIANNMPPKFVQTGSSGSSTGSGASSSEIVLRVKEGPQSIGKLIYTLKGEDQDEDPLTFGVLGAMASDLLRIENVPGNQANVYLRKELDRETTESHQVVITLTDGKLGKGNWITKSMLIIVEDVNDNYPVFGPHRTAISIREDARAPLVVETLEATDADEGRFGQVIYKLDEVFAGLAAAGNNEQQPQQVSSQMFAIETIDGKGVITLIGQLDYESRPLYQLRISAIDRAIEHERLSTTTSILISVEDCEDQPPMFTFAPSITRIPEDLPVGTAILRVSAIDGDRGVNNPIKYSINSVNNQDSGYERNLFSIGSDSGQLSVAHELDRELTLNFDTSGSSMQAKTSASQPGAYVIQVRATEVGGPEVGVDSASVTTELTIILTDVNDETPTFSASHYYGELLENSPAESLVTFVRGAGAGAADAGQGLSQPGVKVIDRDQGTNGTFTLHCEGEHGHLFEVWPSEATNEANLMLKVSGAAATSGALLDYERTRELHLTLVAREKYASPAKTPTPTQRAEMTIYLRDANDNYPQFDSELYRVEIPENAQRGMHICVVKALDVDSGALGSAGVRYTEIRGERANKFKLDPVTGVITLKTNEHGFDREQVAQHHLIVEARDNLGLGNRNTTQLLLVLTDINDQRPKFALDQYEAFIYENELDFQSPLQVQAMDADATGSVNSRITYSIVGGDPQQNFTIDPQTGRIRVRTSLVVHTSSPAQVLTSTSGGGSDLVVGTGEPAATQQGGLDFERIAQKRDDSRQFNLTVRATDAGLPEPLSSTTQVLVLVYDKNDHAPVFTRPLYHKSVREDLAGGSPVLQVQAHDGDHSPTNSKITYRLSSGGSDKFVVDSDTGLISVANGANLDIDRVQGGGQRRTNYLLNVLASDGSFGLSQRSSSALVNISIIDVNNKPPEFVSLGTGSGRASGATSGQLLSTVFVNEDAPYGLIVTRVEATDLDSSAELRYSINYARSEARNEEMLVLEPALYRDVFTIDPTEGTIKVAKQLDRELFDQVKLRLQVEDLAAQTQDQLAYTYLLIKITDINDNRPTFKRPLYKAVVNENSISGTSVITLTADDRDLNKTLKYSLEAATPEVARLVRINPRSGEVTVNDKIDREQFPLINLTVRAEDHGQPHSLMGSTQLLITVRDENDNNPIFLNSTHLRHPTADSPPADLPPNHNNMVAAAAAAAAHANSYRLRSLGPAGSATAASSAADASVPILELLSGANANDQPTETQLISLNAGRHFRSGSGSAGNPMDEQGRELALLAPGATAQVREDAPVGQQIAYVRAEDADVGNNGRVTYLLDHSGGGGAKFRIDRDSGILSVGAPLDREQQRHYTLIIEACDNYDFGYSTGESRRAFTQVNIQVTDINDNTPTISSNLALHQPEHGATSGAAIASPLPAAYPSHEEALQSPGPYAMPLAECLFISEFQAPGEPILTLTATDHDDPETPNGQVDLAIINNLPQNELFSLVPIAVASNKHKPEVIKVGPPEGAAISEELLLNDEPVTVTGSATTTSSTSTPQPTTTTSTTTGSVDSFGDLLVGSESAALQSTSKKQRRSIHDEPRQLEPGNFYLNNGNGRRGGVTSLPSVTTTTTTVAPKAYITQQLASPGGELQMHVVVSQSLKEKVGNYTILVRATDRGQPALTSVKMVNICVQDVNNHAPQFTRPPLNHTIRIMENATIGSYVTQVEASDLDHGLNGELQFSLKPTNIQNSNNDWQAFKIDRLSGVISTTRLFNRQLKKYYTLRVQAQDFGRPTSLSSDIDINIMIVNAGKYQPEFEQQHQSLEFTENSPPGHEWFTLISTTNLDDNPSLINSMKITSSPQVNGSSNWLSTPCYYIIDGDDQEQVFHLDRYTHRLSNQRELDRERKANYTLIVQASNNCQQSMQTPQASRSADGGGGGGEESPVVASSSTANSLDESLARVRRSTIQSTRMSTAPAAAPPPTPTPTPTPNYDALVAQDKSLLKVSIKLRDLNDNAPKFTQRIYTGGITTEADFGTIFMIVQAIDPDDGPHGQVTYSLMKPIKRNLSMFSSAASTTPTNGRQKRAATPTRGISHESVVYTADAQPTTTTTSQPTTTNELTGAFVDNSDELFVISPQTGEISLNFDPQKHMKGYFEFDIQARDSDGLTDTARVLIYLLRQDQRVKFVLRLTPQELRQRLNKFRSVMGNITGAIVNIDSYKYFENHDGTVDKKKTSLYLHFVRQEDNTIIEVDKVLTLIDNNIEYLDELYKEFHVLSSEAAHLPLSSGALVDPIDQVRTGLMGISSFLALILVLVIALCLNQRTRYERQLKAATVSAFGSSPLHLDPDFRSQTNLPNTNLHSQDPNPIWINGHHYGPASDGGNSSCDWLSGGGAGGGQTDQSATKTRSQSRLSGVGGGKNSASNKRRQTTTAANKLNKQLFHSASSGVGMAMDDDDDDEDVDVLDDCRLSSSPSDLNSLSGGVNSVTHLTQCYNDTTTTQHGATTTTATPRDSSLNSSHDCQASSSSGSNSASTTNERQALTTKSAASSRPTNVQVNATTGSKHQAKVKVNNQQLATKKAPIVPSNGGNSSSTFGAYKEVTIYTDHQNQRQPMLANSFSHLAAAEVNKHQQQQLVRHNQNSSHNVNKLTSQFNANKLHKQPTYQQQQQQQQKGGRILVHTNGSDVNQGIIKANINSVNLNVNNSNNNKQLKNNLDAKFVPATSKNNTVVHEQQVLVKTNNMTTAAVQQQQQQQQQRQEPNVNDFETNLSKLSILNLETTEL